MLVRFLKSLWGRARPTPPILLRVTDPSGAPPPVLDVETRWRPSGQRGERSVRTADGLALVPWLAEQEEVELVVRGAHGTATVTVLRASAGGPTLPVRLEGPRRAG